ncbi:MAG: cytochrome c3 family protein [Desulfovibrionaceae bacterium]|nr:cytochrome c3 family protein [Desulfovibrionaceae bacterium]
MEKLLISGAGALLIAALAVPAWAGQPAVPSGPITMELTKKPVVFDHSFHKERQCVECHHEVDGAANFQKCASAGCHDALGQKDKTVHSYFRIAHDRKVEKSYSCLKCHGEVVQAKPDAKKALTACAGSSCHPKN